MTTASFVSFNQEKTHINKFSRLPCFFLERNSWEFESQVWCLKKDELMITVTEFQTLFFAVKRRKRRTFWLVLYTTWGCWKSQKLFMLYNSQAIFSMLIFKLDIQQDTSCLFTQESWKIGSYKQER